MSGNGRTTARSHLPLGDGIDQGGDDDAEGKHGCDEKTGTETASAGVGDRPRYPGADRRARVAEAPPGRRTSPRRRGEPRGGEAERAGPQEADRQTAHRAADAG